MHYRLTIDGMLSVHAKHAVFTALAAVPGIRAADVNAGRAELDTDGVIDEQLLRDAIALAGCTVTDIVRSLPTLG
jgi:copper chaperone CopZ